MEKKNLVFIYKGHIVITHMEGAPVAFVPFGTAIPLSETYITKEAADCMRNAPKQETGGLMLIKDASGEGVLAWMSDPNIVVPAKNVVMDNEADISLLTDAEFEVPAEMLTKLDEVFASGYPEGIPADIYTAPAITEG